jgi:uncharacterized protein YecT (DUF1311 family)
MNRKQVWQWLILLAIGGSGAHAAGFDCAKAADEAEKAICADTEASKLDEDLNRAYALARNAVGAKADTLARDQQNWIADRDNEVREVLREPTEQIRVGQVLRNAYRQRIEFLQSLAGQGAALSTQTRTIQLTLQKPLQAKTSHGDTFLAGLADRGAAVALAKELPIGKEGYIAALPAPPTPELREAMKTAVDELGSLWHLNGLWLREANLGSFYSVQGTLHCVDHTMFAVKDGAARSIESPEVLNGNCWTLVGEIGVLDAVPVALSTSPASVHGLDVVVQTWQDGQWSRRSRLLVRYDATLEGAIGYCQKGDCGAEIAAALGYAQRFARRPLPISLQTKLSAAETKRYAHMQELAQSDDAVKVMPREEQKLIGYGRYGGMDGFANEAVFFPAHLNGELLLARIGHAHVGWREADDWLVGFWRVQGDHLEAVAGVPIGVISSTYLLSAPMAPDKRCGGVGEARDCAQ